VTGVIAAIAAQGLRASVSPAAVSGSSSGLTVRSGYTTASPPGQTYAWSYVSGSLDISAESPTSQTTRFEAIMSPGTTINAVWKCAVTGYGDALVTIELTRF